MSFTSGKCNVARTPPLQRIEFGGFRQLYPFASDITGEALSRVVAYRAGAAGEQTGRPSSISFLIRQQDVPPRRTCPRQEREMRILPHQAMMRAHVFRAAGPRQHRLTPVSRLRAD